MDLNEDTISETRSIEEEEAFMMMEDGDGQDAADLSDEFENEDDDEEAESEDFEFHVMDEKHSSSLAVNVRPLKAYQTDHKSLTATAVHSMLQSDLEQISTLCGVAVPYARSLFKSFGFNKEKLLERYMEDSDRVMREAGLINESVPSLMEDFSFLSPPARSFICGICFSDACDLQETASLPCQHLFCRDCYTHYIVQKIKEDGECKLLQCPASGCKLSIDDRLIQTLVPADIYDRYLHLITRAYIEDTPAWKWCPYPNCEHVVQCSVIRPQQLLTQIPTVSCPDGHRFCHGCSLEDHQPCICPLVRLWLKKCVDDSETSNWIAANTKECIKCYATIEKNGGCNHMTCKKCKHEFCWVCMGPWSEHGQSYYSCNRFDEKSSQEARDSKASSRISLERYLHYFNRYANHQESAKLANEFYIRTEKKMEELQLTSDLSWIEVQFLKKALEVVLDCRSTMKWTYAMAYYLERNNMTALYEDNQRDLEMALEALNELIERPLPNPEDDNQTEILAVLKQQVLDRTEYCARRKDVLLEDTCKGLMEGRWKWNVEV